MLHGDGRANPATRLIDPTPPSTPPIEEADPGKILAPLPFASIIHSPEQPSTMRTLFSGLLLAAALPAVFSSTLALDTWPQWRGASQNGVAQGSDFPVRWSEQEGVAWKVELPGRGGSTPVIDGGTAYLTAGADQKNLLLAMNIEDGSIRWQAEFGADAGGKHRKGSGSNPSPIFDEGLIFAYFRSGDLGCVDSQGRIQWHINLQELYGEDTLWWDLGSSPTVTDNAIVVAVMQTGPSYLAAFDKQTGKELWKSDRILDAPEEAAQSYSTPLAVQVGGQRAIAVMGADHLTLHRASDGHELGRLGGFNPDQEKFWRSISSPVADGNLIVCPYARGNTLTAVRMDQLASGKGAAAIAWVRDDMGSDVPTPAASAGRVYVVHDATSKGTVSCLEIETGKTLWSLELPKSRGSLSISSSPLIAANHLYVTQEDGTTFVLGPLDQAQPEVISINEIADDEPHTVASLVPVDQSLLLRSRHSLYRLSSD
jgi:outer membrane protein assembly factor BamB